MNEKTKQSLDTAKAEKGSLISKKDFLQVIKKVFSPKDPLPESEPAPDDFDNPYLGYEIRQPRTRFMANPFRVLLQWFGEDEDNGYVILFNHLFGNGGTAKELKDILKKVHKDEEYFLVGIPDNSPQF